MDSLTHIALGAVIGELMAGRKLGKKALIIGAVVNSLPDIDFVAGFWLDTARDVVFHRGITHSILFVAVMAVLLGVAGRRVYRSAQMGSGEWIMFMGLELFTHILIDAFNAYGTGWFEPFSHLRVSFNVLFVADPFFSIWLGFPALVLVLLRRSHAARLRLAWSGLLVSILYLAYGIYNKWSVEREVERELQKEGIRMSHFFTTPTPFNTWLWYVVVADSSGYFTGYRSVFDAAARPLDFRSQQRNDSGLEAYRGRRDVGYVLQFAQGYYCVDSMRGQPVLNVMRFGEIQGWRDPEAPFVFHYYLDKSADNQIILQRGRLAGWDGAAWRAFLRRIEGN